VGSHCVGSHRAARAAGLAAACIAVALILTTPAAAAEPSLAADLDGNPIALVEVAQHHCHDFDRPRIHCFRSAAALDDAIAGWTAARPADGTSPSEALATLYVRVYEHQGYQGASLAISSSTTNLGSVGWNDRISSVRVP